MAKKLRVLTPITRDGRTLEYDEDRQPLYRETFIEPTARKALESENASRAEHMRHIIEEVNIPDRRDARKPAPRPQPAAPAKPALNDPGEDVTEDDDLVGPATGSASKKAGKGGR